MNAAGIKLGLGLYTTLFIVFLYGPLAVLAILSFQTGPEGGPQFPIIEWSTYWYKHLFGLTPPSRIAPLATDSSNAVGGEPAQAAPPADAASGNARARPATASR